MTSLAPATTTVYFSAGGGGTRLLLLSQHSLLSLKFCYYTVSQFSCILEPRKLLSGFFQSLRKVN